MYNIVLKALTCQLFGSKDNIFFDVFLPRDVRIVPDVELLQMTTTQSAGRDDVISMS